MPKKVAVVVSDLHLGRGNRLDNFSGDRSFDDFCNSVVAYAQSEQAELTLVLAGDVFEMWECAPDDEIQPSTDWRHIVQHLMYPATSPRERDDAEARVRWQIDEMLSAHPVFRSAIRQLVDRGARIVYLPGNHDHPMVNPAMHEYLRQKLGLNAQQLEIGHWFEDSDLKLYAEHGHQFADADSSYADGTLDQWWIEAPGYHFLRLVYCRLEGTPEIDVPLHELIWIFLKMVYRPDLPNHPAKTYLYEYFKAHEEFGVPLAHGPKVPLVKLPPSGYLLPELYEHWKAHGRPMQANDKLDTKAGKLLKRAKLEKVESTPAGAAGFGATADPGLGRLIQYAGGGQTRDRYWTGFRRRFDRAIDVFPRLGFEDGMTVVGGHTHREHHIRLKDQSGANAGTARYINCGSWSKPGRTTYALVNNFDRDFWSRRLYLYE